MQLLDFIEEHEQAFAYDWRARFGLPLAAVFDGRMAWSESWHLAMTLAGDPTSQVGAAAGKLQYPVSRTALAVMDLYDLTAVANATKKSGRPKPYPRPWDATRSNARPRISQEKLRAALRARGHNV